MKKKSCERNDVKKIQALSSAGNFAVFKTKNWHDDLVNEYHEYFGPS